MPRNVFVLGLDEQNRAELEELPVADELVFHRLLSVDQLVEGKINLSDLLSKAEAELAAFDGTVDAIVGYWDFPVSSMIPILCGRRGLPSAGLEAVLKCEHKYWARLEQQRSIDEYPRFSIIDLDAETAPDNLRYPIWVKPVKAYSSELAFRVASDGQLRRALAEIREGIDRVGDAFDFALGFASLRQEVAEAGGEACLAEESVSGQQLTIEGYNDGTRVHVYGVIDSYNYEGTSSFLRYQYPSSLPRQVIDRLVDVSERIITAIDLRWVFNIEYFWEPATGELHLLEINPRQSQSHAQLFDQVDGLPNHLCMVRLALRQEPALPHRAGPYEVAAKWFYRRFTDGTVRRSPTRQEIDDVERKFPGVVVDVKAREGDRLSDLPEQDSYSYNLADVHIGAANSAELEGTYQQCVELLRFEFDDGR